MLPSLLDSPAMPASTIFQAQPTELSTVQIWNYASPAQQLPIQITTSPDVSLSTRMVKRANSASQAVLIAYDETLAPSSILSDAFGNEICGFWQDYENKNFLQIAKACSWPYSCGTQEKQFGCIGGTSHSSNDGYMYTRCSNVDWNDGTTLRDMTAGVFSCDKFPGATTWSTCQTLHLSGATAYSCADSDNFRSSNIWLLEPTEIWQGFAGYTLTSTPPVSTSGGYIPLDPQTTLPYVMPSNAANDMLSVAGFEVIGCMTSIGSDCGSLYNAMQDLSAGKIERNTFCEFVANTTCPGLCVTKTEPIDRLDWTFAHCADGLVTESTYANHWVDYDAVIELALNSLFPWEWRLQYNESRIDGSVQPHDHPTCPSVGSQLVGFAVTNIVVLILSLIVGHRRVVKAATRGCMGSKGSKLWPFMTIVGICLNLGANVINATLTYHTPGFDQVSIGQLFLLWSSRPRAAWLVIFVAIWDNGSKIYTSAAVSALGTEMVLQALGSYYLGRTVNYGRSAGLYKVHRLDRVPHGQDAVIMYAGALLWLTTVGFAFMYAMWTLTPIGPAVADSVVRGWMKLQNFYYLRMKSIDLSPLPQTSPQEVIQSSDSRHLGCELENNSNSKAPQHLDNESVVEIARPGYKLLHKGIEEELYALDRLGRTTKATKEMKQSIYQVSPKAHDDYDLIRFEQNMGFNGKLKRSFQVIVLLLTLPWIGQWLFWAGFLRMADNLFCPPKLWTNVGVWALFSILGNFFGAGS